MIKYNQKTATTLEPVTLAEVKEHLRVNFTEQDGLIQAYIDSAIDYIETQTGRKLMTQTWLLTCDTWQEAIEIIKFGQLQSITSIKYLDEDEAEQTVSSDDYRIEGIGTDQGKVVFYSDGSFDYPSVFQVEPITIEFVCGYDLLVDNDLPNIIPKALKDAIKFKVSELYADECTEDVVKVFYQPYRLWCF